MKIIGNTHQDHYLVQMSADEISKLICEPVMTRYIHQGQPIVVGTELKVAKAYEELHAFRKAKAQIEKASEMLRAVANIADTASESYVVQPVAEATNPQP